MERVMVMVMAMEMGSDITICIGNLIGEGGEIE